MFSFLLLCIYYSLLFEPLFICLHSSYSDFLILFVWFQQCWAKIAPTGVRLSLLIHRLVCWAG